MQYPVMSALSLRRKAPWILATASATCCASTTPLFQSHDYMNGCRPARIPIGDTRTCKRCLSGNSFEFPSRFLASQAIAASFSIKWRPCQRTVASSVLGAMSLRSFISARKTYACHSARMPQRQLTSWRRLRNYRPPSAINRAFKHSPGYSR